MINDPDDYITSIYREINCEWTEIGKVYRNEETFFSLTAEGKEQVREGPMHVVTKVTMNLGNQGFTCRCETACMTRLADSTLPFVLKMRPGEQRSLYILLVPFYLVSPLPYTIRTHKTMIFLPPKITNMKILSELRRIIQWKYDVWNVFYPWGTMSTYKNQKISQKIIKSFEYMCVRARARIDLCEIVSWTFWRGENRIYEMKSFNYIMFVQYTYIGI